MCLIVYVILGLWLYLDGWIHTASEGVMFTLAYWSVLLIWILLVEDD